MLRICFYKAFLLRFADGGSVVVDLVDLRPGVVVSVAAVVAAVAAALCDAEPEAAEVGGVLLAAIDSAC